MENQKTMKYSTWRIRKLWDILHGESENYGIFFMENQKTLVYSTWRIRKLWNILHGESENYGIGKRFLDSSLDFKWPNKTTTIA